MGLFRKKYYVLNETTKKLNVLSEIEFDIFLSRLNNTPPPKIEVKENHKCREMPSYLEPNIKTGTIFNYCKHGTRRIINSENALKYIEILEKKCESLNDALLIYDRSLDWLNSNKPYEITTRRINLKGEWYDIKSNQMIIDYNNIDKVLVNYLKTPTKEEVFQIIEKLLTIETID